MSSIFNLIIDHQSQLIRVFMVAVLAIIATLLVYWITNRNSFMKYLLGIVLLALSAYWAYLGLGNFVSPEGIQDVYWAILLGVGGIVSIATSFILALTKEPKRKKKKKKKNQAKK